MDPLSFIREFGLPIGLMMIAVVFLLREIRDILKGDLIVPRYVYDDKVADLADTKAELKRAMRLAERGTDVAETAVKKAARSDDRVG